MPVGVCVSEKHWYKAPVVGSCYGLVPKQENCGSTKVFMLVKCCWHIRAKNYALLAQLFIIRADLVQ